MSKKTIITFCIIFSMKLLFGQVNPMDSLEKMVQKDIDQINIDTGFVHTGGRTPSKIEVTLNFISEDTEYTEDGEPIMTENIDFENIKYRLVCVYEIKDKPNFEAIHVKIGLKEGDSDQFKKRFTLKDKPTAEYPFGLLFKDNKAHLFLRDFDKPDPVYIELEVENKDGSKETVEKFDPYTMY